MEKGQSLQHMMLRKFDLLVQKHETRSLPYMLCKNQLKMDLASKSKSWYHQITREKYQGNCQYWHRQRLAGTFSRSSAKQDKNVPISYTTLRSFVLKQQQQCKEAPERRKKTNLSTMQLVKDSYPVFTNNSRNATTKLTIQQAGTWIGIFQMSAFKWPTDTWDQ